MSGWNGRWCRCWRGWRSAASRSTARCLAGFRANWRSAPPHSRTRSTRSPASASPSARQSSSATYCSAAWACRGGSKTKSGQWSTTAQVLEELAAEGYELPRKIVDWRQLTKLKSTYTDALPDYIHPETKRVHTSYALASTSTGRLSSSEPNLQNIPIRTAEGRRIRTAFIAEKGNKLISADYSQIELRVLAHVADIPQLTPGFRRRRRHPCDDGFGNVPRAGRGHAVGSAPPRQGDQFRHHLRHFGLRPRQPAVDPARGGRRLHQALFRALPRHSRLYGPARRRSAARRAMSRRSSGGARIIPKSARPTRSTAPSTNALRSTRRSRARPPTSSAAP